jgi:hypothetical protein
VADVPSANAWKLSLSLEYLHLLTFKFRPQTPSRRKNFAKRSTAFGETGLERRENS